MLAISPWISPRPLPQTPRSITLYKRECRSMVAGLVNTPSSIPLDYRVLNPCPHLIVIAIPLHHHLTGKSFVVLSGLCRTVQPAVVHWQWLEPYRDSTWFCNRCRRLVRIVDLPGMHGYYVWTRTRFRLFGMGAIDEWRLDGADGVDGCGRVSIYGKPATKF